MNIIACLIKEPTKPAKFAVVDIEDEEIVADIIGAKDLDVDIFGGVCGVIHDAVPEKNHKTYNCSIHDTHFYGNIIIAGVTVLKFTDIILFNDIILTPGFVEKYIPVEDKYEGKGTC